MMWGIFEFVFFWAFEWRSNVQVSWTNLVDAILDYRNLLPILELKLLWCCCCCCCCFSWFITARYRKLKCFPNQPPPIFFKDPTNLLGSRNHPPPSSRTESRWSEVWRVWWVCWMWRLPFQSMSCLATATGCIRSHRVASWSSFSTMIDVGFTVYVSS